MRKALFVFGLAASILVMTVGPAAADDTTCMGTLTATTHDNIIVPPNQICILNGVTVRGNVKALQDSRLRINSSTVHGNVIGDKADAVQVLGGTVRENVIIKEGGPAPVTPGFLTCFGTVCEAFVSVTNVSEGNIQIEKMQGSLIVQGVTLFSLNPMRGNIQFNENLVNAPDSLQVNSNRVAQNLQVFKNKGGGTKFVVFNTVGQNLQCFENDLPFNSFGNTAQQRQGQCPL